MREDLPRILRTALLLSPLTHWQGKETEVAQRSPNPHSKSQCSELAPLPLLPKDFLPTQQIPHNVLKMKRKKKAESIQKDQWMVPNSPSPLYFHKQVEKYVKAQIMQYNDTSQRALHHG